MIGTIGTKRRRLVSNGADEVLDDDANDEDEDDEDMLTEYEVPPLRRTGLMNYRKARCRSRKR